MRTMFKSTIAVMDTLNKILTLTMLVFFMCGLVGTANATLITTSGDIPYDKKIVDFSQFNGDFQFTMGPVQVGNLVSEDITWSSTVSNSVIGNGGYGLSSNGSWNSGRAGYVGTNQGSGSAVMTFNFNDGPVAAVGGFVNYAPGQGDNFVITALASDNSILESFDIVALAPISTPYQTNTGAFRGISRTQSDIAAITLSGNYDVLDDLTFGRPVPEPSTCLLFLFGMLGMVGVKKKFG